MNHGNPARQIVIAVERLEPSPPIHQSDPWLDLLHEWALDSQAQREEAGDTEGILFALAKAVEQRDRHTAGHCERLALISVMLGRELGLPRTDLLSLYQGGYLHDIGKMGLPDSVLFKADKLTQNEWQLMRSHTIRGEEICRPLKSLALVLPIIRSHHEKWDGSGYPDGLRGDEIPLLARVVQAADIYDALTSPRAYKPALTPKQALEIMARETDRGWRDPEVISAFLKLNRNVICRLVEHGRNADPAMDDARVSMRNLHRVLAGESAARTARTAELPRVS